MLGMYGTTGSFGLGGNGIVGPSQSNYVGGGGGGKFLSF